MKTIVPRRCGDTNFPVREDNCVPSRISVLLLSAHLKVKLNNQRQCASAIKLYSKKRGQPRALQDIRPPPHRTSQGEMNNQRQSAMRIEKKKRHWYSAQAWLIIIYLKYTEENLATVLLDIKDQSGPKFLPRFREKFFYFLIFKLRLCRIRIRASKLFGRGSEIFSVGSVSLT